MLTDNKRTEIVREVVSGSDRPIGMVEYGLLVASAIEAAVRAELAGQEEVGYVGEYVLPTKKLKAGTPLYAAPIVQPDDLKDAERYRWLRSNSYVGVSARKECLWIPKGVFEIPGKGFDAAIDAAMGNGQS